MSSLFLAGSFAESATGRRGKQVAILHSTCEKPKPISPIVLLNALRERV